MSKDNILTEDDYKKYSLYSEALSYIEKYRDSHGLKNEDINILDYGCARGEMVVSLLEQGYNSFGVDIEENYFKNSEEFFRRRNYDQDKLLSLVNPDGSTRFEDNFFDIIISIQVLEHVVDLDRATDEFERITKPGGIGFHWLPPKWCVVEPHYGIPFVHWLPKNDLRKVLISFFVLLKIYAENWKEAFKGKKFYEIVKAIYIYSVNHTFYRSKSNLSHIFEKNSLQVEFVTIDNPRLKNLGVFYKLLNFTPIKNFVNFFLTNFVHLEILTVKAK